MIAGSPSTSSPSPPTLVTVLQCWGKTVDEGDGYHPALFHMIDVGSVAEALLAPDAPLRFRRSLARALATMDDSLSAWLPFIVAIHDIGKLSAPFQKQSPIHLERLKAAGFPFQPDFGSRAHHTVVGGNFLQDAWSSAFSDWPPALGPIVRAMVARYSWLTKEK